MLVMVLRVMFKFFFPVFFAWVIAGCSGDQSSGAVDNSNSKPNAKPATLLKVELRQATVSTLTDRELKRTSLLISADGGTIDDKVATALLVAEKLAVIQNDMIEVVIERTDLDSITSYPEFKKVVQVSYAPKLDRAPGYNEEIKVRHSDRLVTVSEVQSAYEYDKVLRKFLESGTDQNKAERIAGEQIAKKFGLPRDWKMPINSLIDSNAKRENYFIKSDQTALDSVYAILGCIGDKTNVTVKKCS